MKPKIRLGPKRPRCSQFWIHCVLLFSACAVRAEDLDFNRDIRPILSDKCFRCHGPDSSQRQADLRLDQEDAAKASVIVPGNVEASEFAVRILSEDGDLRMPPEDSGKRLTPRELQQLLEWIRQGAPYSPAWAYVPPRRHPLPEVKAKDWAENEIDLFLLANLEREGLGVSPDADPVTLVRRLSFDLTGLPPAPETVAAFVRDDSPEAYERLVDDLLASEAYGERMAMYWLDLVRYADTVGYHGDQDHNISPYRDYVIDAFNENLPFDRFTREQLAGDLVADAGLDQQIASGYNRLLQTSHEGGVQPKEYLTIYAADRVRNLSAVWLGGTLGCAQCHDHKYDPYTTRDFYAMAAFFADIDEAEHFRRGTNALPTARPPEIRVLSRRQRQRIAELEQQLQKLAAQPGRDATESNKSALQREIESIRGDARTTMITVSIAPRTTRVLPRGNWLDETGPVVQPAVPEFLRRQMPATEDRRLTRLDLANWLCDPEQGVGGLTARVFANRIWYLLFGSGIARNLDDFGGQGEPPSHPELLDQLAIKFLESGWDVKYLVKQVVMSHAYRQSSTETDADRARDPFNRLYGRQSRWRLPAEMVRDNALAISGLLVQELGGPSVKPYQPAGYYRHLNFPTREYQHDTDARQWRRGVYVHWQRMFLHPMLKAFDAPSREECTAERPRSNTPLAALALLNDPTFVEAARVFAARILREGGGDDTSRLQFAFRMAVNRCPDAVERQVLKDLLADANRRYAADSEAAAQLLRIGHAPAAETANVGEGANTGVGTGTADLAAWTTVARAILNLSETMTRN